MNRSLIETGKYLILISSLMIALSACSGSGGKDEGKVTRSDSVDACGIVNLPTVETKIINGDICGGLASSPIVRVVAKISNGLDTALFPVCTGTMVSADDVITATHCFIEDNIEGFPIVEYGIVYGEVGAAFYLPAVYISAAPGFTISNERLFNDVSLMTLAAVPGLNIIPILLSRSPAEGELGYVYGYGRKETGEPQSIDEIISDTLTLAAGSMTIATVTPNHLFVSFNGEGTNVCNGDSGGPIIIPVNGIPTLAGTTSQGSVDGCVEGDVTTFINLQNPGILNWIASEVPDAAVY